jgi:hypothetical protein
MDMRKRIVLAAIVLLSCFGSGANAQVALNVNIGVQPLWGPVGYDYAQYYYIPDIGAYYDVGNQDFVYQQNGQWVTSAYLPPAYTNFDLYGAYKVVINAPNPWLRDDMYRNRYYSYLGRHDQPVTRDTRDRRYWANPAHPMHYRYQQEHEWGGYRPRE